MSERGKGFEQKFARWLKEKHYYHERFFDSRSVGGLTVPRPADYFVYYNRQLYYIECKESEVGSNIAFNRLTQMNKLLQCKKAGIISYFLMGFKTGNMFAIEVSKLYEFAKTCEKKSINEKDAEQIGISIKNKDDLKYIFMGENNV